MNEEGNKSYEANMLDYLKQRVSRAQLLKASAAGLALAALPKAVGAQTLTFPFYPQVSGTYTPEAITGILNIADTAEHLAVTFLTAAVKNANTLGLKGLVLQIVQAALAEEQYHVDFLDAAGASPLTTNFSVPDPKMLSDFNTFFATLEVAESIFVAAYMTAVREFAEVGQPTLAKYAYQIGAVEAEHRALVRAALALAGNDHVPPNNKAFETDLFVYVADAAKVLSDLGFLGTGAIKASYPGRDAALDAAGDMAKAVIQQKPNNATTSVTAAAGLGALTGERS